MADKVYIGADHAGYEMKEELEQFLKSKGITVEDLGTHSTESADYPDFAHLVAEKVAADHDSIGILLCGSANGVCITANKHKTIRAALAWNEEIAMLARAHNDAKQWAQAIFACNGALKLNPDDGETHFYLGRALKEVGRNADAAKSFDKAVAGLIKFTKDNPDYSDGFYLLGNA